MGMLKLRDVKTACFCREVRWGCVVIAMDDSGWRWSEGSEGKWDFKFGDWRNGFWDLPGPGSGLSWFRARDCELQMADLDEVSKMSG